MNAILNFMKRNYKILLVIVALSVAFWSFMPREKNDPEKDKLLLELLTFVVERGHYDPAAIDDKFSKGIYKDYMEALDPSKRFFLQSDIDEFSKFNETYAKFFPLEPPARATVEVSRLPKSVGIEIETIAYKE